jgi:hypothetical protein
MFVQVIQGKVRDKAEVRAQLDRWVSDLAPNAVGWLGTTAGVADDGTFVALARFESAAAADKNGSMPEQGEWWDATAATFDGEPTFHDSTSVDLDQAGDPATAGFVQVMQGQVSDFDRMRDLLISDDLDTSGVRPDIVARLMCGHDDGRWTMAVWFTSEEAAREGERTMPHEIVERLSQLDEMSIGERTFIDLRDPWMHGPA